MAEMTKRERVAAALAGRQVDRPPVAFWRHWPIDDQDPESLTRATLDYQHYFDFDFIKLTPSHTFCVADYGVVHEYRGRDVGDRTRTVPVIKRPEDWDRIEPLDLRRGAFGRQLQCLRMVVERKDPDTPLIQTVFNPIGMARYLATDEQLYLVHLRQHPDRVLHALAALAQTCAAFAAAAVREGADGIFMSTAAASFDAMSREEHDRFARPFDLQVLRAANENSGWFNVLHLHGQFPMFAELADYPVPAVNWHDRAAGPSLAEAMRIFPGALAAGVEQWVTLHFGTPAEVEAQVLDAIAQTGGRRLIVAAGCTYPLTVPEGNLLAARRAVEKA